MKQQTKQRQTTRRRQGSQKHRTGTHRSSVRTDNRRFLSPSILFATVVFAAVFGAYPAAACGWWGDGEGDDGDAIEIDANGRPIPDETTGRPFVVTRENGAGIAVYSSKRASRLGSGAILKIAGLKTAGFTLLVDLDGEGDEAALHRLESETLGMAYINLPIPHALPSPDQMKAFVSIIEKQTKYPIAIYADETQTLAALWTMYRYSKTNDAQTAYTEGRRLGLSPASERYLDKQFRKKARQ